ncbi:MAG TPA: CHAT domain-containing protein [Candidatus Cloacimonadota bacterium]|nr:CHAT domain-containing protein [Candidatus Cloacimonadota bacterium]
MKKIIWILILFNAINFCFASDLNQEWITITTHYQNNEFDSVSTKIVPFINQLESLSAWTNLIPAYFYQASAKLLSGQYDQADSLFDQLIVFSEKYQLSDSIKDIRYKQTSLYVKAFQDLKEEKHPSCIKVLTKAINLSLAYRINNYLAVLYYERALLNEKNGMNSLMEADLLKSIEINEQLSQNESLKKNAQEKLAKLYVDRKQYQELDKLKLNTNANIELKIQTALDLESKGDYIKADQVLVSIQNEVFTNLSDERIMDFIKKRFLLYDRRNLSKSALDTLDVTIDKLNKLSKSHGLLFSVSEFRIAAFLYNGLSNEAGIASEKLSKQFAKWNLSTDYHARFYKMMGDISYLKGSIKQAITHYNKAIEYAVSLDKLQYYELLNNLGLAYEKDKQTEKARENFVRIYNETANTQYIDNHYRAGINLGLIYTKTDKLPEASHLYEEIRISAQRKELYYLFISASLRLAEVYQMQGFDSMAGNLFYQIEGMKNYLQNPLEKTQVAISLSDYYAKTGNLIKSLKFLNEADVLANENKLVHFQNAIQEKMAQMNFNQGNYSQARKSYEQLIKYYQEQDDLYNILVTRLKIALTWMSEKDYQETEKVIKNILIKTYKGKSEYKNLMIEDVIYVDIFCKSMIYYSSVHFLQATQQENIGLMMKSLDEIDDIITFMDNNRYIFIQDSQSEFEKNSFINAYKLKVDICANLYNRTNDPKYLENAFDVSEKARSQAFISEAGAQIISKLNNPKIKDMNGAQYAFISNKSQIELETGNGLERGLKIKGGSKNSEILATELQYTQQKYNELVNTLKDDKSSQLIDINTLSLSSIQNILESDETIMNYYVSSNNCYLFIIHKDKTSLITIAESYAQISNLIDQYRAQIMDYNSLAYKTNSQSLYNLLVKPVENEIKNKNLIIIPSGKLNNLPFATLHNQSEFLLENHIICQLPNISLIQFINLKKQMPSQMSVFAIGNPDNPIASRLPGTETEVRKIQELIPNSSFVLGLESNRSRIMKEMENKTILHFATHGLFEPEYPLLSGLILSPEHQKDDGILRLFEIYNLNLSETRLVVLSACETGLAKIKQNDDVIGLVRGFFFAGASNIIASLWQVSDTATSELMIAFYQNLNSGKSMSKSIQNAQLSLIAKPATTHPYYWGAFNLYGFAH